MSQKRCCIDKHTLHLTLHSDKVHLIMRKHKRAGMLSTCISKGDPSVQQCQMWMAFHCLESEDLTCSLVPLSLPGHIFRAL